MIVIVVKEMKFRPGLISLLYQLKASWYKLLYCIPLTQLTLKSAFFLNSKKCLLIGKYGVSQLTIKLDIKQKRIHWATRGSLNNHCNNNGLLGVKQ